MFQWHVYTYFSGGLVFAVNAIRCPWHLCTRTHQIPHLVQPSGDGLWWRHKADKETPMVYDCPLRAAALFKGQSWRLVCQLQCPPLKQALIMKEIYCISKLRSQGESQLRGKLNSVAQQCPLEPVSLQVCSAFWEAPAPQVWLPCDSRMAASPSWGPVLPCPRPAEESFVKLLLQNQSVAWSGSLGKGSLTSFRLRVGLWHCFVT